MVSLLRSPRARFAFACVFSLLILTLWKLGQARDHQALSINRHEHDTIDKALVVASTKHENTSWLHQELPDWHKYIYIVDDPTALLTVARNKGRESMVYLS
jgi:hypothetical protein